MESRKRAHSHEDDPTTTKKHIISAANGSPRVNGASAEPDELELGKNLESFRKEAIYRRMKHYFRENERSLARIAELERRKNTCEAGLAAISACWSQLVDAIRLLAKPENIPESSVSTQDIFDLAIHLQNDAADDITRALENKFNATQSLVTKFIQLGGVTPFKLVESDVYADCQNAKTECAALRSQLDLLRIRLRDSEALKEQYHTALTAAENRIERVQSATVIGMERSSGSEKLDVKAEQPEETPLKPSSPPSLHSPSPTDGKQLNANAEVLQEVLKLREAKIVELERDIFSLREQVLAKDIYSKHPSSESIIEHPTYRSLLEREEVVQKALTERDEQIARLTEEINQMQSSRKDWEESILSASNQSLQELKAMMSKRDADNARLRDQREQLAAEILERKQKESIKQSSFQEYKNLAESRSERIVVLESEVKRLKTRLAAEASNEDLMTFIAEDGNATTSAYIDALRNRAINAEARVTALEQSLAIFQDDHPDVVEHMRSEAEARMKLAEVTAQLEKYQRVYGNSSTLPPDVSHLAEQLKQKENELQRLRLINTQQTQAEASLFAELEKLSTSWEALDRQVKSKILDLSQMEDRLNKSGLDKAKSDNKFFAAMRDKEAIDVERKNVARNMEKQAKAVERFVDQERNLNDQVGDLEKEVGLLKKGYDTLKRENFKLQAEMIDLRHLKEYEKRMKDAAKGVYNERERELQIQISKYRSTEEGLARARKEAEQQILEWKKSAASTSQNKQDKQANEVQSLKELLRCSTCKTHFRNTVITKCMHTFCKQCVEARIATRQRKCPACNLVFAQSDVQTLWFQ
ncbi:hypothetical protein AMATHDRAFT_136911 [Amanita thiersii Skay4041]|uniref:E3 ubiquitin protein ligase n=1 Tax=Amanita thiersii Skay4041 TaxID=703135 RepID=A0A2A9NZ64_9AGAR|nr:hypothetical protein AMATHDRAFT_136911 [Amanita thiersii Skay4041]